MTTQERTRELRRLRQVMALCSLVMALMDGGWTYSPLPDPKLGLVFGLISGLLLALDTLILVFTSNDYRTTVFSVLSTAAILFGLSWVTLFFIPPHVVHLWTNLATGLLIAIAVELQSNQ